MLKKPFAILLVLLILTAGLPGCARAEDSALPLDKVPRLSLSVSYDEDLSPDGTRWLDITLSCRGDAAMTVQGAYLLLKPAHGIRVLSGDGFIPLKDFPVSGSQSARIRIGCDEIPAGTADEDAPELVIEAHTDNLGNCRYTARFDASPVCRVLVFHCDPGEEEAAVRMASLWQESYYHGQPVRVSSYPLQTLVTDAIEAACAEADDNDLTCIYIATHGSSSRIKTSGAGTNIALVDFFRQLNTYKGRLAVIIDCCRSGTAVDVASAAERTADGEEAPDYAVDPDRFFVLSSMDRDNPVVFGKFSELVQRRVKALSKKNPRITCSDLYQDLKRRDFSGIDRDSSEPADTLPENQGRDDPFALPEESPDTILKAIWYIVLSAYDVPQAVLTDAKSYGNGSIPLWLFDQDDSETDYLPLALLEEDTVSNRVILDGNILDKKTGKPLEGVAVSVYLNGGRQLMTTSTNSSGYWYVQSCQTYTSLYFEKKGYRDEGYISLFGRQIGHGASGHTSLLYDMSMEPLAGSISGVVTDAETGQLLDRVTVVYTALSGGTGTAVSASDGSFAFSDLPADAYTLSFSREAYEGSTVSVTLDDGVSLALDEPVRLKPAGGESLTLTGRTLNSRTGEALSGVTVSLLKADIPVLETVTGEDGAFQMRVSADMPALQGPGSVRIVLSKPGFESLEVISNDEVYVLEPLLLEERDSRPLDYALYGDETAELRRYHADGASHSFTVPDTLEGRPVTSIHDYCFHWEGFSLERIVLPEGLFRIGNGAFFQCENLSDVTIPDGVVRIDNGAFSGCKALAAVTLPDTVRRIGDDAFASTALTRIVLPDSVTEVGNNPFSRSPVEAFILSDSHPYLETRAGVLFSKPDRRLICYSVALTASEYTVPEGTEIVGANAFLCCDHLQRVVIPEGVTTIESGAFSMCPNLAEVTLPASLSAIAKHAFSLCSDDLRFVVPAGSYAEQYCLDHHWTYSAQ